MEEIHQTIEVLGGETIELPGSLWYGIDSVDAATGDKPCEFPHPYRLDAVHADPEYFPKENLEWTARMVLEKQAKVESTAIREMREEVKKMLMDKKNNKDGKERNNQ